MKTRISALNMKLFLLLSIIVIARAGVTRRDVQCNGYFIAGNPYSKEVLKTDLDRPYLLTTDYSTDTIYFSYSVKGEEEHFKSAKINLNNKEFSDLEGVPNGFAQSVDNKTHELYVGGNDGIYKYNANSNKAEYYGANGTDIWTLYFKDVLYFSNFPSQFLYTIVDGEITRFKDLEDTMVYNFVIDNENNLFFSNGSGLYSQKKGTKDAVSYTNDDINARGLTTDKDGDVFVCVKDGIYYVNKTTHSLNKLLDVEDAFGVTFDSKGNIIYSDATSVVRLKPC